MLAPSLCAGIKQTRHPPGIRINGCEIRPFAKIAALAGPSEIRRIVRTRMLPRNDMICVERPQGKIILVKTAVLTSRAGAVANQSANTRGHQAAECSAR
jgi:hypothetical protein